MPLLFAADQDASLFLGKDLIVWLVLAFGAALVAGNLAAILRPPQQRRGGTGQALRRSVPDGRRAVGPTGRTGGRPARQATARTTPAKGTGATKDTTTTGKHAEPLEAAPIGRALAMAGIGLVAAIWALVSLVTR